MFTCFAIGVTFFASVTTLATFGMVLAIVCPSLRMRNEPANGYISAWLRYLALATPSSALAVWLWWQALAP